MGIGWMLHPAPSPVGERLMKDPNMKRGAEALSDRAASRERLEQMLDSGEVLASLTVAALKAEAGDPTDTLRFAVITDNLSRSQTLDLLGKAAAAMQSPQTAKALRRARDGKAARDEITIDARERGALPGFHGGTIASGFDGYLRAVVPAPEVLPAEVREALRQAFFAGAAHLYSTLVLDPTEEVEPPGEAEMMPLITLLENELREFADAMLQRQAAQHAKH